MTTTTEVTSRRIPSVRQAGSHPLLRTLALAAQSVERTHSDRYVFPTYQQWNISETAPESGSYYHFAADGRRFLVER